MAYLDGLAQAHFVGEDAVEMVVVEGHEPVEADHLVGLQLSADQHLGLALDLLLDPVDHRVVGLLDHLRRGARRFDFAAAATLRRRLGSRTALLSLLLLALALFVGFGRRRFVEVRQDPETLDNPDTWTVLEDLEGNVFCVTSSATLSGWV